VNDYFYLNQYTNNLQQLINAINFNDIPGTTNTQAALTFTQNNEFTTANGKRPGIPSTVVFISEGYSTVLEGSSDSANAGSALRMSGVTIYGVALGTSPNMIEILALSSSPSSTHTFSLGSGDNGTDPTTVSNALLAQLCAS